VARVSELLFLPGSETLGAPSLRTLQGRVRCCLYHEVSGRVKTGAAGDIAPTLAKNARMGHPLC